MTLVDRERKLRQRIEATPPEQSRQLIRFAWACVQRTSLPHLSGRSRLLDALLMVERWLKGEPVEQLLHAMHDEVFEAALGVGRFEPDMTGLRAACWSVYELYQASLTANSRESRRAVRKAANAAALACRADDGGPTPSDLDHQERLFQETFTP